MSDPCRPADDVHDDNIQRRAGRHLAFRATMLRKRGVSGGILDVDSNLRMAHQPPRGLIGVKLAVVFEDVDDLDLRITLELEYVLVRDAHVRTNAVDVVVAPMVWQRLEQQRLQ